VLFRSARVSRTDVSLIRLANQVIRHDSSDYFLGVSASADTLAIGTYRFSVTIDRGGEPPTRRGQVLYLDFDGSTLDRSLLGITEVPPFDAESVSPLYAGDDEIIKQAIVETVKRSFEGLDVLILTSDDGPRPGPPVSSISFGSFHESVFGVAVGADSYNRDRCDDGIVFAETFSPFAFGFPVTREGIGLAMGNVASHEAGHLLGLLHVTDSTALMDERSPAFVLLVDQQFKTAPLASSVFPVGKQNAPTLLIETVGEPE